jgi:hypothetical protein
MEALCVLCEEQAETFLVVVKEVVTDFKAV